MVVANLKDRLKAAIVNDRSRQKIMFIGLNAALALVALVMSIVNIFTAEYLLMGSTLIFSILCLLNIAFVRTKASDKAVYYCFGAEALVLLSFFFISGIPDGFSALWVCLIPSFALLIFGRKYGSLFSLIALMIMVFLFWIPAGQALLQYGYTSTFMLRFPFLYVAIYLISLLEEYVREETRKQLAEAQDKYHYLYRHDALTGLYNRYGFDEMIDATFEHPEHKRVAVMILDIDNFKHVNDHYGHSAGDVVLKTVANLPKSVLCDHCRYSRWGGEEFIVLMQCDHDASQMAEKIRALVQDSAIEYEDKKIHVTVSIGVCTAEDISRVSIASMINQADACLYTSKAHGKNKVTSAVLA